MDSTLPPDSPSSADSGQNESHNALPGLKEQARRSFGEARQSLALALSVYNPLQKNRPDLPEDKDDLFYHVSNFAQATTDMAIIGEPVTLKEDEKKILDWASGAGGPFVAAAKAVLGRSARDDISEEDAKASLAGEWRWGVNVGSHAREVRLEGANASEARKLAEQVEAELAVIIAKGGLLRSGLGGKEAVALAERWKRDLADLEKGSRRVTVREDYDTFFNDGPFLSPGVIKAPFYHLLPFGGPARDVAILWLKAGLKLIGEDVALTADELGKAELFIKQHPVHSLHAQAAFAILATKNAKILRQGGLELDGRKLGPDSVEGGRNDTKKTIEGIGVDLDDSKK